MKQYLRWLLRKINKVSIMNHQLLIYLLLTYVLVDFYLVPKKLKVDRALRLKHFVIAATLLSGSYAFNHVIIWKHPIVNTFILLNGGPYPC